MSDTIEAGDEQLHEASLLSHLLELRSRLLKAFSAVLVIFVCLIPFAKKLFAFAAEPLLSVLPEGNTMIATNVASPIIAPLKLAFFVGLCAAMPVVLYQAWAFVAPGLYRKEKRFAVPLLLSSIGLFYLGIMFAYFVVFPLIFTFLSGVALDEAPMMTDITAYLDFVLPLCFAFGIAFEVPVATVLLVWARLTTPETLGRARPYVFLGCFVVGMFLTPPDVISQTLLAVPVYLLYELGIIMSRMMIGRERESSADASAG